MKKLLVVWMLLMGAVAAIAAENVLERTDFSSMEEGAALPRPPWQTSDGDQGISVRIGTPSGAANDGWVELIDRSGAASASASLRQQFEPVRNGRLSLRVHLADEHAAEFGIYLGKGEASSTTDRVVDMKTNQWGVLRVGTRGHRQNTPLVLEPGGTYHFFIEFISANRDRFLLFVVGTYDENGDEEILARIEAGENPEPVNGLRITTDNAPTGAHFFITDIELIDRDA